MKIKYLQILTFIIYLLPSNYAYSIEEPNIKNIIIHKEPKKIENIIFNNSENKTVELNDFSGKLIILNFWATWCAPCIEEMPSLNSLKKDKLLKNLEILAVNVGGEDVGTSKQFFKNLKINNLEIYVGQGPLIGKKLKIRGLPTTIFINKDSLEIARVIGFVNFKDESFLKWLKNLN